VFALKAGARPLVGWGASPVWSAPPGGLGGFIPLIVMALVFQVTGSYTVGCAPLERRVCLRDLYG
jgi:hypothetical protein